MERREHDRRIEDIDTKLCKHLKEVEGIDFIEMKKDIKEIKEMLANLDFDSLRSVAQVFNGAVTFRKFVIGLASVFVALSAIGGALIWLVKQAVK